VTESVTVKPASETESTFEVDVTGTNAHPDDGGIVTGDTLVVNTSVTNVGNATATETVQLKDFDDDPVAAKQVNLAAGQSTTVELRWTTSVGDEGDDLMNVSTSDDYELADVLIERDINESGEFEIVSVESNADDTEDRSIDVGKGQNLELEVTVRNNGKPDSQTVWLEDIDGDLLPGDTSTEVPSSGVLPNGKEETFNMTWASASPNTDTVYVQTVDDSSGHQVDIRREATDGDVEMEILEDQTDATGPTDAIVAGQDTLTMTLEVNNTKSVPVTVSLWTQFGGPYDLGEVSSDTNTTIQLEWEPHSTHWAEDSVAIWVEARDGNNPGTQVYVEPPETDTGGPGSDDDTGVEIDIGEIEVD
jgi:hypothetical protein